MTGTVPQLILTPAEIARWTEDCARIDRDVERLLKKKEDTQKKIEAARLLAPSLFEVAEERAPPGRGMSVKRKGITTWPIIIEEHVRTSGTGLKQKDLLE